MPALQNIGSLCFRPKNFMKQALYKYFNKKNIQSLNATSALLLQRIQIGF